MQAAGNSVHSMNLSLLGRWASILGGVSLISYGMKKGSVGGKLLAILGGDLVYCGTTGYSPLWSALGFRPGASRLGKSASIPYQQGIRVDADITIEKPPEQLYSFWRNLENLPRFMQHLCRVTPIDQKRSHWVAQGPAGQIVEWDAEIINEQPNGLIGWRSLPGADVDTAGSVHFKPAGTNCGTDVHVELQYLPPAGKVGAALAKLMGNDPADQVKEDLRRLKEALENADKVQLASEESFPASDAPSWAGTVSP
jgi:uncharacterized membrane protein